MKRGLLASLTCLLLAACGASGPTPTITPPPTRTVGAQQTPPPTAQPTTGPTTAATAPAPTTSPSPIDEIGWTERADVAAGPSAREDHTWTVESGGQIAYLFGGRASDGPSNELWAFDLVSDEWTQLRPSGAAPAPRFGHTATWVPDVGLVVWSGQGATFFDDIWAYDPLTDAWYELPSLGAVPEARYGSCASLGPDGRMWISHGFTQDDGRFADTRAYDFTTSEWTDMTPDASADVPVKRCLHDCFWARAGLILYGGQTTDVPALGDIWEYSLEDEHWSRGRSSEAPNRQLYALAPIDPNTALVFGGGSYDRGFLNDAWTIDAVSLELSRLDIDPATAPPRRSGATLIGDAAGDRLLLFGGQNESGLLGDMWELNLPD